MIITRASLRISFVGGGTDLPKFYHQYPGRVISTTIDKYVYIALNKNVFNKDFILKYSLTEIVRSPNEIKNTRFRAAIQEYYKNSDKPLEISSIADLPSKTGLGSSSSFSCALIKAIYALQGENASKEKIAKEASRLEIEILKEPIGKQDQYAAAYGGLNIIQFNPDESVNVEPVLMDFKQLNNFNSHLSLFYTGMTRNASDVLAKQQQKLPNQLETYKKMSDSVYDFKKYLLKSDYKKIAEMLHEGWLRKKSLSENISNSQIDKIYQFALKNGAWGGKILGAGNGGCLLFISEPNKKNELKKNLENFTKSLGLYEFEEIPFRFTRSGTDILFNNS